jgi:hypothetical protein
MASYTMMDLREKINRHRGGEIVAPPSSATTRGVEISMVATSRKASTCMHQWVGEKSHMHRSP